MAEIGATQLVVSVEGVDLTRGVVMVRDSFDNQLEVDATFLGKATGVPAEGERWLLVKRLGRWTMDTRLALPTLPTITGDVSALGPAIWQILQALADHGLVVDATTGSGLVTADLDDTSDPMPDAIVAGDLLDYTDDQTLADDGYTPPTSPETDPEDTTGGGDENDPHPATDQRYSRISVATHHVGLHTGPQRFQRDLTAMAATRADVIALQGADAASHGVTSLAGWTLFRPTATDLGDTVAAGDLRPRDNTLLWRTSTVQEIDSGVERLVEEDTTDWPSRYATWARLHHVASGVTFTVIDVRLDARLAPDGEWDTDIPRAKRDRLTESLTGIKALVRQHAASGPVLVVGDFGYRWEQAVHKGFPQGLPRAELREVGLVSNWQTLGMGKQPTRRGAGWTSYQWLASRVTGQITAEWQKVLQGYAGEHLPLIVTYKVRNRGVKSGKGRG